MAERCCYRPPRLFHDPEKAPDYRPRKWRGDDVLDLWLSGWAMKDVASLSGFTLADVAKIVGGRVRGRCCPAENAADDDDALRVLRLGQSAEQSALAAYRAEMRRRIWARKRDRD